MIRQDFCTATLARSIEHAARLLAAGELVAFPTETVYGLGCNAESPSAVARLYAVKGRPLTHPVIVHLAPQADPAYWASRLPDAARRLIDVFWPGPLTLIVERAAHIPNAVSGGQRTVALRCPSHPVAQALLRAFRACGASGSGIGNGIAAPSANRFGRLSPTTAQHVRDELGDAVYLLDGGPCEIGIESTIVDLSRGFPALLRPGQITPQQLAEALGTAPRLPDGSDAAAPRAPGTLKAHYAPRTPLALLNRDKLARAIAQRAPGKRIAVVARAAFDVTGASAPEVHFVAAPKTPQRYAHDLYQLLRTLDHAGVQRILIEQPPNTPDWAAINDRLGRAAAAFQECN